MPSGKDRIKEGKNSPDPSVIDVLKIEKQKMERSLPASFCTSSKVQFLDFFEIWNLMLMIFK